MPSVWTDALGKGFAVAAEENARNASASTQLAATSREVARTASELARVSEILRAEAGKFRV